MKTLSASVRALSICLAVALPAAAQAPKHGMTVDDMQKMVRVGPPVVSPPVPADGDVVTNSSKPTGTTIRAATATAIHLSTNCSPGPMESARPDHLAQPMQLPPDQHE